MTDCPQKPYGCSCAPGECRSVTIDLDTRARRYRDAIIGYQNAVLHAFCVGVVMIGLAGLLALAAVTAEAQFRKQDMRMQEVARHD